MSKELEALRRFRNNAKIDNKSDYYLSTQYIDDNDIIESALKRLELYESNQIFIERAKKLKVLEILKSKEMLSVFKDIHGKCFVAFNTTAIEIPQKEYDSLREVFYE